MRVRAAKRCAAVLIAAVAAAAAAPAAAAGQSWLELGGAEAERIAIDWLRWEAGETGRKGGVRQTAVSDQVGEHRVAPGAGQGHDPRASSVSRETLRGKAIPHLYFENEVKTAREAGSGMAEGRRDYQPPASGTLTFRPLAPWGACAVGRSFASAALVSGTRSFVLTGLEVTRCGQTVTVAYRTAAGAGERG